ncbi:MAG: hypothetical protein KC496_11180 [Anaerolineae bacterium]|nr:hypothetical protein [Anaerolineae bacterium]
MAFHTSWLEEPFILATTFSDVVTSIDLKMAMLEYLGAAQEQPTYFLLDFTQANYVPEKLLDLPLLLQVMNHANTRWLAIVKPESEASYMTQILTKDRTRIFRDRESAAYFLRKMIAYDAAEEGDPSL